MKIILKVVVWIWAIAFPLMFLPPEAIAFPLLAQADILPTRTRAALTDPSGTSNLRGQFMATETLEGLQIDVAIQNAPAGLHGIHIHEGSSCADNGNAARGHFNPAGVKHGNLVREGYENAHAGDLGNISIDPDGSGRYSGVVPGLTVASGKYAIADHAVILHASTDDFKTQPTGNAGGRIGCGVLGSP